MSVLQRPTRSALVAAAFVATYLLTYAVAPAAPVTPPSLAGLPFELAPWAGQEAPPLTPEVAKILAADEYVHRFYSGPQGAIEMDVSYYTQPRVGTTMHSPLNCLPGNGWEIASAAMRTLNTAIGTWDVRELTVKRGNSTYALTYWIQSRDRVHTAIAARTYPPLSRCAASGPSPAGRERGPSPRHRSARRPRRGHPAASPSPAAWASCFSAEGPTPCKPDASSCG